MWVGRSIFQEKSLREGREGMEKQDRFEREVGKEGTTISSKKLYTLEEMSSMFR